MARWQVAAMKILIKKKSQVKKLSFVELQNTKQPLTKSGFMMTNTKAFPTTQTLILFTVPIVQCVEKMFMFLIKHKRFKKTL